ncbi:MAG TPA: type I DNA topoisomerase [Thermoanaerobaculia bacterium]|jgi:DNA topoisomerase-1|nr:type I DNA topoisomerase [Thermoanaerobaculia bacterium]
MAKNLVIVESPAKAKTINKFIGSDYVVKASVGHVRDLPRSDLGVDEVTFLPHYEILEGKEKVVSELKAAAKKADKIFIASDPDREGEAIGWHVMTLLGVDAKKVQRILFHEITKNAVKKAIETPGEIDMNKVNAQQARRVLDRLVGYKLSPLLWDKVRRGLSAGRVQSVAMKMIVEREDEIKAFLPVEYWSFAARLAAQTPPQFTAKLTKVDGKKAEVANEEIARKIETALKSGKYVITEVARKERKQSAAPPFITSTLQRTAYNRFKWPVKRTMQVAQKLYEGKELGTFGFAGLITYMRTDSVRTSDDALTEVRSYIAAKYGNDILPEKPNAYRVKKAAQAQDAHEAIRPTSMELDPEKVKDFLTREEYNLYKMIWDRFVGSQMKPALFDVTDADIQVGNLTLRASGEVQKFAGFLAIFQDAPGEDDDEDPAAANDKKNDKALPPLNEGDVLELIDLETKQNFTQPPPRFTEATLVKALEENGIGRPSTYGSILTTIQARDYTYKHDGKFHPTHLGALVVKLLKQSFADIIDEGYTADLEEKLDQVEDGTLEWTDALRAFSVKFNSDLERAGTEMTQVKGTGLETDEKCETCGSPMVIKFGRFGEFLACTNYPECKTTKEMPKGDAAEATSDDEQIICDKCGKPMQLKRSRFGQFFACTGYPDCKNTKDPKLMKQAANLPTEPQPPCENCGKEMVLKSGRYGPFYSCAGYPDCKTIRKIGRSSKPPVPTGVKCPTCGEGELVERISRRGVFYSCNRYPKCEFTLNNRPAARECPKCHAPYLLEKETKREGHIEYCNNAECDYRAPITATVAANE